MRTAMLVLFALSTGCGLVTRPADVYYRAAYIAAHHDRLHGANLCMETFCTRTDVTKKFAGGHKGYTSQAFYNYCPIHTPGFVNTGSRFDDFLRFWYWIACFVISLVVVTMILLAPYGLIELIRTKLKPGHTAEVPEKYMMAASYVALAINAGAWALFAIY